MTQEKNSKETERNNILEDLLVNMVQNSGEHGLSVSDILVSFMNNRLLLEEREEIIQQMELTEI